MILPQNTALVIVDVQRAIDDPSWAIDGPRNNPGAEANIAALLATWRRIGYPVFHVRDDGTLSTSTYRPGQPGNAFKPEAAPLPGETIIVKHTNKHQTKAGAAGYSGARSRTKRRAEAERRGAPSRAKQTRVYRHRARSLASPRKDLHARHARRYHEQLSGSDGPDGR
jgi:hypothetical protein